jgi:hypothetical protein
MGPAGGFMALMSGPTYGAVNQMPSDKERRINVHFRIPYMTKWGQSIVVTGTGALNSTCSRHTAFREAVGSVVLPTQRSSTLCQRTMQQEQQDPCIHVSLVTACTATSARKVKTAANSRCATDKR